MVINFGTWENYPLGEKLFVADLKRRQYSDNDINYELNYYKGTATAKVKQETAEIFVELLGGTASGNNTLFGTPIDRSKENVERMHAITLSMAADTGKHDNKPSAYNAAIVPLYALKNPDGTFVLPSGGRTTDPEKARTYTDRAEAESHRLSKQVIVEI